MFDAFGPRSKRRKSSTSDSETVCEAEERGRRKRRLIHPAQIGIDKLSLSPTTSRENRSHVVYIDSLESDSDSENTPVDSQSEVTFPAELAKRLKSLEEDRLNQAASTLRLTKLPGLPDPSSQALVLYKPVLAAPVINVEEPADQDQQINLDALDVPAPPSSPMLSDQDIDILEAEEDLQSMDID